MEKVNWKAGKRKLSDLIFNEKNPRRITEKGLKDLGRSIDKFGLAEPIVINANNRIIGGHARFLTLKQQGTTEADCFVASRVLNEEEEKELNVRLNKNIAGEWDYDILANEFNLDDLLDWGFDEKELNFQIETSPEDDEVPEVRQTDIQAGDLFQLGEHRLLCGDATKADDLFRLLGNEKADMIFTDPPYNVDYGVSKNPRDKIRTIKNDKQSPEEWQDFCKNLFINFKQFNKGDIYMWGAPGPEGMKMRLWLTEVWEIDRPHDSKLHPTMKPIDLCIKGIMNSSLRDAIVLDCFGGSGSTLIACEKARRKCRMIEIDPQYCQVIIDRWEQSTGDKAEKIIKLEDQTVCSEGED